jgi:hypothetical protein
MSYAANAHNPLWTPLDRADPLDIANNLLYVPQVEKGFCRYLSILGGVFSLWEGLHRARGDELDSAECWTFPGKEKEERAG